MRSGADPLAARVRDHSSQLLAGLEDRHRTRGDFYRIAGPRVARHARLALPDLERPKPANLNVMLFGEGGFHGVEERIDDAGAVFLRSEERRVGKEGRSRWWRAE